MLTRRNVIVLVTGCCLLCLMFQRTFGESDSLSSDPAEQVIAGLVTQARTLQHGYLYDSALTLLFQARQVAAEHDDRWDALDADIFTGIGSCYFDLAKFKECETYWDSALVISSGRLQDDGPGVVDRLTDLCRLYIELERFIEAGSVIDRAANLVDDLQIANSPHYATVLYWRAVLSRNLGDYEHAKSQAIRSLDIRKTRFGQDSEEVAATLHELALLSNASGELSQAEEYINQAIAIHNSAPGQTSLALAESLRVAALISVQLGNYSEAEAIHQRVLKTRERVLGPAHPDVAATLADMAGVHFYSGKYNEMVSPLKRAVSIFKGRYGNEHSELAGTVNILGAAYAAMGRHAEAAVAFEEALQLYESSLGPTHSRVGLLTSNLGSLHLLMGNYKKSEAYLLKAIEIRSQALGNDHPDVAMSINVLANLYGRLGRHAEIEPLLARALAIREKSLPPGHSLIAMTLSSFGRHYYSLGRYSEAEPYLARALELRDESLGSLHPNVSSSMRDLALLFGSSGDFSKSLEHFSKMLELRHQFVRSVFPASSEAQKLRWIDQHPLLDHALLTLALNKVSRQASELAFEMVLKGKAAVVDAVMSEKEIAICSADSAVAQCWQHYQRACTDLANIAVASMKGSSGDWPGDTIVMLCRQRDSLEERLSRHCSEFAELKKEERPRISSVAERLSKETVLWEFVEYIPFDFDAQGQEEERYGDRRYLAFTLNADGHITLDDLGDASEIDGRIRRVRRLINDAGLHLSTPLGAHLESQLQQETSALHTLLFEPLQKHMVDQTTVLVSPDGMLNFLPFEILTCSDNTYAIERFRISYLTSGRDLLRVREPQPPTSTVVIIADADFDHSGTREKVFAGGPTVPIVEPHRHSECFGTSFNSLHHTLGEAHSVGQLVGQRRGFKVLKYSGTEAAEETVKSLPEPPWVLHLATHGFFCAPADSAATGEQGNPLVRSGVALAGANLPSTGSDGNGRLPEDGMLTALEVSGLNLRATELVALSACETGMGELVSGEGVFGLRRAFQHAGAESVLMSLWKVPDEETSKLMIGFYERWLNGSTKQEALRGSALEMLDVSRRTQGHGHPLLWAGFVLTGQAD